MGVALFDLDRTLIDVNSATSWIRHERKDGRLSFTNSLRGAYWILRSQLGYAEGVEKIYETAVAMLEGQAEAELDARTRAWFAEQIAPRLRPGAAAALDAHRVAGDRLVLATSSSTYAAREAQRTWGFDDVVATSFEVVDGCFTGKVARMAYGDHKLARVAEWATSTGADLDGAAFYTDSITDRALLERVGRPVAVNPDGKLRRLAAERGWTVVDWGRAAP